MRKPINLALRFWIVLAICVLPSFQQDEGIEEFHEELFINPLANGFVNSYFQFTTRWRFGARNHLHNTRLVPRAIAEILLQYDVKELHIALTQGLWRYETWGYPVVDAGAGAEAWAWFSNNEHNLTASEVDEQWISLASTFSGILCASLNFIDRTNSVEPKYGFRPRFVTPKRGNERPSSHLRYSTLPREIVCTENLTPWKKLLPCYSKEGFASLLNSGHVHNTNYHSLAINVRTLCESEDNCILEFTETANLVYDSKLLDSKDFSLRRLFGQGLNGHCVLAKSSRIYVNLNEHSSNYELSPEPMETITSLRGAIKTTFGIYDIQKLPSADKLFNIAWLNRKPNAPPVMSSPPPPLYAHRFILGKGQERGKIITEVTNTHYRPLSVVMQENIPWYVPSYMHTLQLKVIAGPKGSSSGVNKAVTIVQPKALHYVPGVQRTRPYHLELAFEVPALSTMQISFDFDYIFLKWLEYPPDANHGHYLGSAVLFSQLTVARNYTSVPMDGCYLFADSFNASRAIYFLELRTEALLLSLPTPDFSMPYNVICLACTVVALAFGPIHSVATKRIVVEHRDSFGGVGGASLSFFGRLKRKLFDFFTQSNSAKKQPQTSEERQTDQDAILQPSEAADELASLN